MEQFEYMTKCINIFHAEEINILGKEGWELIQVLQKSDNTYFGVFKRKY